MDLRQLFYYTILNESNFFFVNHDIPKKSSKWSVSISAISDETIQAQSVYQISFFSKSRIRFVCVYFGITIRAAIPTTCVRDINISNCRCIPPQEKQASGVAKHIKPAIPIAFHRLTPRDQSDKTRSRVGAVCCVFALIAFIHNIL